MLFWNNNEILGMFYTSERVTIMKNHLVKIEFGEDTKVKDLKSMKSLIGENFPFIRYEILLNEKVIYIANETALKSEKIDYKELKKQIDYQSDNKEDYQKEIVSSEKDTNIKKVDLKSVDKKKEIMKELKVLVKEDEEKTEDKNHITVSDNLKEDEHGMVILSFAN